jgi:ABC-type nickel/cobalt efflux system permease component RcnA
MPGETKREKDDSLVAVSTGTVIWLIVGGVLLVLRERIPQGSEWWLGTCAVAVISGVGGILYLRRRRRRTPRAGA